MSHTIKYPNSPILGFLIGTESEIKDVIPISHNHINSAIFHVSLEIINLSRVLKNGLKIIGLYEANEKSLEDDMLEAEKKILKKLEEDGKLQNTFLISMKVKVNGRGNESRD